MAGKRAHGEGNVSKRKTAAGTVYWYVEWTYRDEQGSMKRKGRSFPTQKLANAHLRQVVTEIETGRYLGSKPGTVAEWLDLWMAGTVFMELKPQTRTAYRRHVRAMKPRIGDLLLSDLNGGHLNAMYAELAVSGNHTECCKKKKPCGSHVGASGLSKTTIRHHHNTLASALKAAVEAKRVLHAVTADARPPSPKAAKAEAKKFQTWNRYEVALFLEATQDDAFYPIWHMLLTTGCRRGEVLGMRWSDLDEDEDSVTVEQTIGSDCENEAGIRQVTTQNSTKGGVGRTIALDPGTMKMLRKHKQAYRKDRLRFGGRWTENDLIFYRGMGGVRCMQPGMPLDGEKVSARWIETLLALIEADEDIKRIRLHDARHTWATLALKAGEPVKVVQERLGHSHSSITLDIYAHVTKGMDRDAANRVAGLYDLGKRHRLDETG